MNKAQLVEAVALDAHLTKVEARKAVDAIIRVTVQSLREGERLVRPGARGVDVEHKVLPLHGVHGCVARVAHHVGDGAGGDEEGVDPFNGITCHSTALRECIDKGAEFIGWDELRERFL